MSGSNVLLYEITEKRRFPDSSGSYEPCVPACFHGTLVSWAMLPKKENRSLERTIGASLSMALAGDGPACEKLSRELRKHLTVENEYFLDWGHGHFHMLGFHNSDEGLIPADLVLDLYLQNDMVPWLASGDLPER